MALRSIALFAALTTALVGALPSVSAHRCLEMGRLMPATHSCCPQARSAPSARLGRPCCETIAAPHKIARANSARVAAVAPPLFIGVLTFAPTVAPPLRAVRLSGLARGRPPGDRQQLLSSILRV